MNKNESRYTRFALCREMLETPALTRRFEASAVTHLTQLVVGYSAILLTGEGSSRIFPAKRARAQALRTPGALVPFIEGATQAMEYHLGDSGVLGASNSGRTRELIRLFKRLRQNGHTGLGGVTAQAGTPLEEASDAVFVLGCGQENAVAATKSVVEQAMVWQAVLNAINGQEFPETASLADGMEEALTQPIPEAFSRAMAAARTTFFAGRNDGVAEELALKTNEIVRKPSGYLEGTYAAHGIEEVMHEDDVLILVDPFPEEEAKLKKCLADDVGLNIFAVADRDTLFPTLRVPAQDPWREYILLAAGWNLLVEAGITAGVNLDETKRARKVGNEYGVS